MNTSSLIKDKMFLCEFPWSRTIDRELNSLRNGNKVIVPPAYEKEPIDFSGTIDWSAWNQDLPGFQWWLNGFKYLRPLFSPKGRKPEDINIANKILSSWFYNNPFEKPSSNFAWDGHATAIRAEHLACLYSLGCNEEWLLASIKQHGEILSDEDFHQGNWNHGLDQDIGLLSLGCAIDCKSWQELAYKRAMENFHNSVDEEGVSNEQAVGYQYYVFLRFNDLKEKLDSCGLPMDVGALKRLSKMLEFSAHSVTPDGRWEQLGDTLSIEAKKDAIDLEKYGKGSQLEYAVTFGKSGQRPQKHVVVYKSGYVFGRSGWGVNRSFQDESFYSIRFGPGRVVHGHNDHTSITYHHNGKRALTDGGFHGYTGDKMRDHLRRPEAHNVVMSPDENKFHWQEETKLISYNYKGEWQAFLLKDNPYPKTLRTRSVLFHLKYGFLVVLDKVHSSGSKTFQQIWNFDKSYAVESLNNDSVTLVSEFGKAQVKQIWPYDKIEIYSGSDSPTRGWGGYSRYELCKIPTIVTSKKSSFSTFLTLVSFFEFGEAPTIAQRPIKKNGVDRELRIKMQNADFTVNLMEDESLVLKD